MRKALILGGTGQIGQAVAEWLGGTGWQVRVASRSGPMAGQATDHVQLDPQDPKALARAVAGGVDLLMDCAAFDADDAERLRAVAADVGRIVAVSSASVYRDGAGRTLDEAPLSGFPDFGGPVGEDHPTVAPGPETYSTRKIAMEARLLDGTTAPVTILRPAAIHGPWSRHAREWWVVKRLLDGRPVIPLCRGGASRFHTTSTEAIARAVALAADGAAAEVVNVVDGDAPTVTQIADTAMATLGTRAELLPLPGPPGADHVGKTPWSVEHPLLFTSSLPPMRRYDQTAPAALRWLAAHVPTVGWEPLIPVLAAYPRDHFDYAAEDRLLRRLRA